MKLSKLSAALFTALAVSMSQGALASEKDHDAAPKHGGIVSVAKDVNYEQVAKPDALTLYVIDHGKPVSTKGGSATLTLLSGAEKAEVKLDPAGENKLEAKGTFKVQPGTKIAGTVKLEGKTANVKYTVK